MPGNYLGYSIVYHTSQTIYTNLYCVFVSNYRVMSGLFLDIEFTRTSIEHHIGSSEPSAQG